MAKGPRIFSANDKQQRRYPTFLNVELQAGNLTADVTKEFVAPFDGSFANIADVFLSVDEAGVDGSNPLNVALDVQINGVTIFSTQPSIDKTAGNGAQKTTLAAGTGLVVGVLNAAAVAFSKGAKINVIADVTRTTPGTEIAGVYAVVGLTESQDHEPDGTVDVTS